MGMERVISFPAGTPEWSVIRDRLLSAGASPAMRMIDGMPAFPDETPEPTWSELRITLGAGMMTIRREPTRLRVIVWGNADEGLLGDLESVVQGCVAVGGELV